MTDANEPDDPVIDEAVRTLVEALDAVPGVTTLSSCAGHDDLDAHAGAVPASEFYVAFRVTPDDAGWAALDRIAWAIRERELADAESRGDDLRLDAWHDNGNDSPTYQQNLPGLAFELHGLDYASPAALARVIATSLRGGRRKSPRSR